MALAGGVSPYLQDFLKIPTSPFRDSVNGAIDTAADPLSMQYSGACNDAVGLRDPTSPVPGGPGTPGGGGGGFDFVAFWRQLIQKLISGIGNAFNFNINNIIDGTSFWRITNSQLMNNMKRY